MARLFSRLAVGSMITFGFAFTLGIFPEAAWGAPIACTGSTSGSAGTCSTIANCSGTTETPVSSGGSGGPSTQVCPESWICCIAASSGGTKPPKDLDPPSNQGTACEAALPGGGTPQSGICEFTDQCTAANSVPVSTCLGGTICCVTQASNAGGGNQNGSGNQCYSNSLNKDGQCYLNSYCNSINGIDGGVSSCIASYEVCCVPPSGGGTNTGPVACASGSGTCTTIANCGLTPLSDTSTCGGSICCPNAGVIDTTSGGGTTTTGSLNCSTGYQKIAGVCFPQGTGLSEKSVLEIIAALISWLLAIFGFIALLGFIISGIQYLLSTGDEGMAETAKRNMKYSIIGIIVALSGWIIIKAVDALLNANSLI